MECKRGTRNTDSPLPVFKIVYIVGHNIKEYKNITKHSKLIL